MKTVVLFLTLMAFGLPAFSQENFCSYRDLSNLTLEIARKMLRLDSSDSIVGLDFMAGTPTYYASSRDPMKRVLANEAEKKAVEIIKKCYDAFLKGQQKVPASTTADSVMLREDENIVRFHSSTKEESAQAYVSVPTLISAIFIAVLVGVMLTLVFLCLCNKESAREGLYRFQSEFDRRQMPGGPQNAHGCIHNFIVAAVRGLGLGLARICRRKPANQVDNTESPHSSSPHAEMNRVQEYINNIPNTAVTVDQEVVNLSDLSSDITATSCQSCFERQARSNRVPFRGIEVPPPVLPKTNFRQQDLPVPASWAPRSFLFPDNRPSMTTFRADPVRVIDAEDCTSQTPTIISRGSNKCCNSEATYHNI